MDGKARMAQKTIVRSEYEYRGARWAETSGGDRGLACQDERMGAWFFRHAFGEGGDGEKLAAPPARFLSPATTDAQRRRVLERFKQLTIVCTWEEPESSFRLSFARNRFGAHCVGYLGLRRKVESAGSRLQHGRLRGARVCPRACGRGAVAAFRRLLARSSERRRLRVVAADGNRWRALLSRAGGRRMAARAGGAVSLP